jgi:hypothetical protein
MYFFMAVLLLINNVGVGLERIVGADDVVDVGRVEGVEIGDVVELAAAAMFDGDDAGGLRTDDGTAAVLLFGAGGTQHKGSNTY